MKYQVLPSIWPVVDLLCGDLSWFDLGSCNLPHTVFRRFEEVRRALVFGNAIADSYAKPISRITDSGLNRRKGDRHLFAADKR
jgi:hypothetical protein